MPGLRLIDIASSEEAVRELFAIGVDTTGIKLMAPKMTHLNIRLDGITCAQASVAGRELPKRV